MMTAVAQALGMAFAMGWEILWPLILGCCSLRWSGALSGLAGRKCSE
jgi:hypothetical protein